MVVSLFLQYVYRFVLLAYCSQFYLFYSCLCFRLFYILNKFQSNSENLIFNMLTNPTKYIFKQKASLFNTVFRFVLINLSKLSKTTEFIFVQILLQKNSLILNFVCVRLFEGKIVNELSRFLKMVVRICFHLKQHSGFFQQQLLMWQNQPSRLKTTVLYNHQSKKRRLKSLSTKPSLKVPSYANVDEMIYNLTKMQYHNNNNAKIQTGSPFKVNLSPCKNRNKIGSHFQNLQNQARAQLSKLAYKEKIFQIQNIVRSTKQLTKIYGYFSVTFAMLKFHLDQKVKIEIWIHPDRRCTKPLHPIKKSTQFQCQLLCVSDIKQLIKQLFPTIDLGDCKTFGTLIIHIDNLKMGCPPKTRSRRISRHEQQKNEFYNYSADTNSNRENILLVSAKTIPGMRCQRINLETNDDENFRKTQNNIKIIQTASTLVQTIKFVNSANAKQKNSHSPSTQIAKTKQSPSSKKLKQSLSMPIAEAKDFFSQEEILLDPQNHSKTLRSSKKEQPKQPSPKITLQTHENRINSPMRTSTLGRRYMTMSTQIQSEINNLFGDEMHLNVFYQRNLEVKNLKNSILSKVAQQFQDLF